MGEVVGKLEGHSLQLIAALGHATGMRRGELLALRWCDVDLEAATLRLERLLEETKRAALQAPRSMRISAIPDS